MTGFIGGGNMAEALIKGMLNLNSEFRIQNSGGGKEIIVSEPREDRRHEL